jgi:hypothetical protein
MGVDGRDRVKLTSAVMSRCRGDLKRVHARICLRFAGWWVVHIRHLTLTPIRLDRALSILAATSRPWLLGIVKLSFPARCRGLFRYILATSSNFSGQNTIVSILALYLPNNRKSTIYSSGFSTPQNTFRHVNRGATTPPGTWIRHFTRSGKPHRASHSSPPLARTANSPSDSPSWSAVSS